MSGRRQLQRVPLTIEQRRIALGMILCGLVALAAWAVIREDAARPVPGVPAAVSTSAPVPTVTVIADPAPVVTAAPAPVDPTDAAAAVKPLRDLTQGDRVIYTAEPNGPGVVCVWQTWDASIAVSTISCGDEPAFQTPTGYLTPVETRP